MTKVERSNLRDRESEFCVLAVRAVDGDLLDDASYCRKHALDVALGAHRCSGVQGDRRPLDVTLRVRTNAPVCKCPQGNCEKRGEVTLELRTSDGELLMLVWLCMSCIRNCLCLSWELAPDTNVRLMD